ncbi:hypothetical protein BDD12DRAFT_869176 [Trichophaea hybrida]|nr:hypothetical protein BDD12DRAFT_869176 [Trichophaea hybrida]
MAATLTPGAYVIRNRYIPNVIHTDDGVSVTTSSRDEERHRERQIWWVEADPVLEDLPDETEAVYRFANIAKDISLDVEGGRSDDKTKVTVYSSNGAPCQLWRLKKQPNDTEGSSKMFFSTASLFPVCRVLNFLHLLYRAYYHILNANSGLALDVHGNLRICNVKLNYWSQYWQLQKPIVSVPAGWLRLQNVASSQVLSHTYLSLPPTTVPTPTSPTPRESWATQWAFVQASALGDGSSGSRIYMIKNRLTGGHLRCGPSKAIHREAVGSVNAWDAKCYGFDTEFWSFELDAESNWMVVHKSGFLLEETDVRLLSGNEVACTTKTHHKKKTWVFIDIDKSVATSCPPLRDNGL